MLKSCRYCGRIHDSAYDCGKKTQRIYDEDRSSEAVRFRNRKVWRRKADEIKERDLSLCRKCLSEGRYVYHGLSVHHIVPLEEDFTKRLDNDNLITLCSQCHGAAENGSINRDILLSLAVSPPVQAAFLQASQTPHPSPQKT